MGHDEATTQSAWERLARRINESDAGELHCDGLKWRYVPALLCRRILSSVFGPAGWQTKLSYSDGAAVCHLTIDEHGETTCRAGIGYDYPDLAAGDAAFIAACEQFGVGQDLVLSDARWIRPRRTAAAPAEPARNGSSNGHAPRGDEPPREEREREQTNGSQRSHGDHGPRGPRNGGGWGSGNRGGSNPRRRRSGGNGYGGRGGQQNRDPSHGNQLWPWAKRLQEENPAAKGLIDHLSEWAKDQGLPDRFVDFDDGETADAVAEAYDYMGGATSRR